MHNFWSHSHSMFLTIGTISSLQLQISIRCLTLIIIATSAAGALWTLFRNSKSKSDRTAAHVEKLDAAADDLQRLRAERPADTRKMVQAVNTMIEADGKLNGCFGVEARSEELLFYLRRGLVTRTNAESTSIEEIMAIEKRVLGLMKER